MRVTDYPLGLVRAAAAFPDGPWMYTGGLENSPGLIERISGNRPLYGIQGAGLAGVRDPFRVASVLADNGLPAVPVSETAAVGWLRKPLRSCGGGRIDVVPPGRTEGACEKGRQRGIRISGHYFQQRVNGVPCSAVYVAGVWGATLLGISRQLIGTAWTGASGFQYGGSIGPLAVGDRTRGLFLQVGDCLARRFQLRGLFGVDAVLADEFPFTVEVNPRYTASVEILERTLGVDAVGLHVRACRGLEVDSSSGLTGSCVSGKAIVYARRRARVNAGIDLLATELNQQHDRPGLADIPRAQTEITAGEPAVTVLADGPTEAEVERELVRRVGRVQSVLGI
jgi:predicted ATP-grasp superfamily ATP-dependent carboligase